MADTRAKLLENFDEDVHTRLRLNGQRTSDQISRFEEWLWRLTAHELGEWADFEAPALQPARLPAAWHRCSPTGRCRLVTHKNGLNDHQYRLSSLAEFAIARARKSHSHLGRYLDYGATTEDQPRRGRGKSG
jgi:hypothetical protein